eukprot:3944110-Pleurochrysis_carterae.AAC.1
MHLFVRARKAQFIGDEFRAIMVLNAVDPGVSRQRKKSSLGFKRVDPDTQRSLARFRRKDLRARAMYVSK